MDRIYLDNSATTPISDEARAAMQPYYDVEFGNASSLHEYGRKARQAIEESREEIAAGLGVSAREIVFTSGATEADNLAILGAAMAAPQRKHILVSAVEHHAVLHAADWLASAQGYSVERVPVDAAGWVDPNVVREMLRDDTLLVSVMAGNNEIGTVQPIDEVGAMCRERAILFHTDAVQAIGKLALSLGSVDLLAASAHKFNGPKGAGFLFVRKGTRLAPLVHGGGHENGLRSGTENVPGIVGTSAAVRLALAERQTLAARLLALRTHLIEGVLSIPGTRLNGQRDGGLPHIANFSFQGIEGESLVMRLDEHGIATSTGSACSSPDLEPSHVLVAIGVPLSMAHGSLRVSTGRQTTHEEIERFLEVLPGVVENLRAISPFKVGE